MSHEQVRLRLRLVNTDDIPLPRRYLGTTDCNSLVDHSFERVSEERMVDYDVAEP